MIKKLIYNFIFGGTFFSLIYYFANILQNPAISAIVATIPLTILCTYIIHSNNMRISYLTHVIPIYFISLSCVLLLIYIFKKQLLTKNKAITLVLVLWCTLQLLKLKFFKSFKLF